MNELSEVMNQNPSEGVKLRGFFRVNIEDPDGSIVGDSGWVENQITDLGIDQYLSSLLGAIAGSKQVGFVVLGTGSAPASNGTNLQGECVGTASGAPGSLRQAVTAATTVDGATRGVRFTATFASSNSFVSATNNISNIGLFNTAAYTTGTIFAGNTFASSSCATNQAVNVSYVINFSR